LPGKDGLNGKNGMDGIDGQPGQPGKVGETGDPGPAGGECRKSLLFDFLRHTHSIRLPFCSHNPQHLAFKDLAETLVNQGAGADGVSPVPKACKDQSDSQARPARPALLVQLRFRMRRSRSRALPLDYLLDGTP
jgi:hypothetical protein